MAKSLLLSTKDLDLHTTKNYIKAKDIDKMAETMRPYIDCGEK